jgi:hypothetical protein
MRLSKATRALIVCALLVLLGGSARAAVWSVGPNLGLDVLTSQGDNLVLIGVPASSGPFLGFTPGLRLGVRDASEQNQLFFDTGLQVISSSGSSLYTFTGTANYARAFHEGSSPYVTAGLGVHVIGGDGSSERLLRYGAGLGIRQVLPHGHGAIRIETRVDVLDPTETLIQSLTDFGLRIGFDLDLD